MGANDLWSAAHVVLLKATKSFANCSFEFSQCSHNDTSHYQGIPRRKPSFYGQNGNGGKPPFCRDTDGSKSFPDNDFLSGQPLGPKQAIALAPFPATSRERRGRRRQLCRRRAGRKRSSCRCFIGRFFQWLRAAVDRSIRTPASMVVSSASQWLTKLVQQAEENVLPRIPGQKAVNYLPPGPDDLRRDADQRPPKRGEVHPQQLTLSPPHAFSFQRPSSGSNNAAQAFRLHASEAITMYAQLLTGCPPGPKATARRS